MKILNFTYMIPILCLLLMSLVFCNAPAEEDEGLTSITLVEGYHFAYNLKEPDQTFKMPKDLEEISGLGISEDGDALVAVQDEDGRLFFINRYSGQVFMEAEFWKDGDYEGVEMVGGTAYVVKSSGTLYEVKKGDTQIASAPRSATWSSRSMMPGRSPTPSPLLSRKLRG